MALFDPGELDRTVALLGRLATAAAGVLAATGIVLLVGYRPGGSTGWVSSLHWTASALFIGCTAGVVACAAAATVRRHRSWVGWRVALAAFVVAGAGTATGQLVRWTGVRPPGDPRGLFGPLGGDVTAVVVGGSSVSAGTFLVWSLVHVLVVPAAAVGVGVWFERRRRAWQAAPESPAPGEAPPVTADPPDGPNGVAAP